MKVSRAEEHSTYSRISCKMPLPNVNVSVVDQVPVVIYELNESAINFISQESFEKALILLQKAQTMLDQI